MIIKEVPEDFIVKEISSVRAGTSGPYTYYRLKKKGLTTLQACMRISRFLRKSLRDIGYAGNKDRQAVTEQLISIRRGPKNVPLLHISLEWIGYGHEPISLGMLDGNAFIITVRGIESQDLHCENIINYFGTQRFSSHNVEIGVLLLKRQWKEAAALHNENCNVPIDESLEGLKKIPRRLLLLYIHSVQSWIWNKCARYCVENNVQIVTIPLIGFGTFAEGPLSEYVSVLLNEFDIGYRDFAIRQFPEISCEGDHRALRVLVGEFRAIWTDDEKHQGKKVVLTFSLPPGSYATEVVAQVLD